MQKAFPGFAVKPWLCVVNKGHHVTRNETMAHFRAVRDEQDPKARPEVRYSGNLQELMGTHLLALRDVSGETDRLIQEVQTKADALAALLDPQGVATRVQETVADFYKTCRSCEYRFYDGRPAERHGFAECWGEMATAQPHILDLYRVTQIDPDPVPALLAQGQASLLDLQEHQLGKAGARQERRRIQWSNSRNGGREYLPQALKNELLVHQNDPGWPLRFMDFEACNVALPHHAGLCPYDRVAFQWSCHTLDQKGELTHADWLNTERDFPNFNFALTLRLQVGEKGTVYVWSHYEQTTLRRVLTQIEEWVQRDEQEALRVSGLSLDEIKDLASWLDRVLGPRDAKGKHHHPPRIRDLHKLAFKHYFHPEMLGRTSIKVVLPAVWRQSAALRNHPWFAQYLKLDSHGQALDPYEALPALPLGDAEEDEKSITDGTGAIRVYQDLIFRQEADPQFCANRQQLLRQYCKLDTAAMLMIWKHWMGE